MAPTDLFNHLLNFVAPAFVVAVLCTVLGRLSLGKAARAPGLWVQAAVNFVVGVAVLGAGLVVFGADGRMATYVALALACGTSQWLVAGNWRR